MHVYTADGRTLLVLDAFGLTRLVFPNKVRTEPKIMGSALSSLGVDRDGTRVLAWNDGFDQTYVLNLSDFKPVIKSERFNLSRPGLLPDGVHVLRLDGRSLTMRPLNRKPTHTLTLPGAPSMPISLGEGPLHPVMYDQRLRVGADGTFAVVWSSGGATELHLGRVSANAAPLFLGSWLLELRGGGALWLHPREGAVDVVWHDLANARAFIARVSNTGIVARQELLAWGAPAPRGDHWVVQTARDTVVETDRDGVVHHTWTLPEAFCGAGEVMPHDNVVMFMPSDRERFVNLETGEVIPRKLKAQELPVRAYFADLMERYNLAARHFGREMYLGEVRYWNNRTTASGFLACNSSEGTFGGVIFASMLYQRFARGEKSLGAFSSGGASASGYAVTDFERPFDVSDVEAIFAACDEARVWLGDALDSFRAMSGGRYASTPSPAHQSALAASDPAAFALLLRGLLHHLVDATAPRLTPEVNEWKARPIDAATLRALIPQIDFKVSALAYATFDGLMFLMEKVLPIEEVGPLMVWMSLDTDPMFSAKVSSAAVTVLSRLRVQRPALADACRAAVEAHAPAMVYGIDARTALLDGLASGR